MTSATSVMDLERGAVVRALMRTRLLLGCYGDVIKRAYLRLLSRIYCVAIAYMAIILFTINLIKYPRTFIPLLPVTIEYAVIVLSSILAEKNLLTFCDEIVKTDLEMGLYDTPFLPKPMKIIFAVDLTYQTLSFIINAIVFPHSLWNLITYFLHIMASAVLLNSLCRGLSFDLMRHRFRLLRFGLEADLNLRRPNTIHQIKAIKSCLNKYKLLVDMMAANFTWEKVLLCLSYVMEFAKLLIYGYEFISIVALGTMVQQLLRVPMVLQSIVTCITCCLPAVFCELIDKEVGELKILIANQQFLCDDAAVCSALEQAEEYLHQRRARVTIGRACALDATLVLAFVSLFTTYFIVMIQFTNIM